jgi:enoyl-CoA hydratase/carnithine racemase
MTGSIRLKTDSHVATVTLESPGKLNAISVSMWNELRSVFEAFADDSALSCVVIRGAAGNFAAGADIEELAEVRFDETSGRRYHLETVGPALEAIRAAPQTVIAAIEGICIGGGLEIAVACDLRVAIEGARLGAPVGRLGFPLALPELQPLVALVGPGVAAELLLAGSVFEARDAQARGLVHSVAAAADFESRVSEMTRAVLANSPLASREHKRFIRLLGARGAQVTPRELDESFAFLASNDRREGVAAFLAKRPARFTGT